MEHILTRKEAKNVADKASKELEQTFTFWKNWIQSAYQAIGRIQWMPNPLEEYRSLWQSPKKTCSEGLILLHHVELQDSDSETHNT